MNATNHTRIVYIFFFMLSSCCIKEGDAAFLGQIRFKSVAGQSRPSGAFVWIHPQKHCVCREELLYFAHLELRHRGGLIRTAKNTALFRQCRVWPRRRRGDRERKSMCLAAITRPTRTNVVRQGNKFPPPAKKNEERGTNLDPGQFVFRCCHGVKA